MREGRDQIGHRLKGDGRWGIFTRTRVRPYCKQSFSTRWIQISIAHFLETYCRHSKWTMGDLNPRHLGCKPSTLPTELIALQAVRVSLSFLRFHTRSIVALRSGPTPTLEMVTPIRPSNVLMYCWAGIGSPLNPIPSSLHFFATPSHSSVDN